MVKIFTGVTAQILLHAHLLTNLHKITGTKIHISIPKKLSYHKLIADTFKLSKMIRLKNITKQIETLNSKEEENLSVDNKTQESTLEQVPGMTNIRSI